MTDDTNVPKGREESQHEPGPDTADAEPETTREGDDDTTSVAASIPKRRLGRGEKRTDDELFEEAFVLLFASPEPISPARLSDLLERPAPVRVQRVLERLAAELESGPLPLRLQRVAGTWRITTDPAHAETVLRLSREKRPERISGAALETLAIVAYRQSVTKAEIEAIRGVQAGPVLRALVDRRLIRITGRADVPGSPLLYGTTKDFLERFGLDRLEDLPRDGELVEES